MKSDPARHTAKSLFCLFSTAVVLTMLHSVSSKLKKMFYKEYVNSFCYSMYYHYLKRFIDIFFYEFILPNMRFGIPVGTGVVTQYGNRRSRFCKSRDIAQRVINDFSRHHWMSESDNL
jgi:hypothetical protein